MGLKGRINKLTRQAEEGAVLIKLRDGTTKVFDDLTCFKEMFLVRMDLFSGESKPSEVLEAVRAATPESRRAFEREYGEIEMVAKIIAPDYQGAWCEVYRLTESGEVEKTRHEGHTEEARRLREEARQQPPAFYDSF
jgi:hypothetical protein